MAKKISNESFVEKDFGQPVIDALKEILQLNKELANQLKETGKEASKSLQGLNPSESVKDAQKLTKELEKLTKAKEELNKVETNDIKITKELQKAEAEKLKQDKAALDLAVKENKVKQEQQKTLLAEKKVVQQQQKIIVANRKERERQFKEREKERKQRTKQLTEYQKESRRLTELRNRYKDLAVAEKENTKEAKALLKEVVALDKKLKKLDETVGQNQRSVGDYKKALEGLKDQAKALPFLAVAGGVALLGQAFGDTREGSLQLQILFSKITETVKVLIQNIIQAAKGVPLIFEGLKDKFKEFGDDIRTVLINTELAYQKIERTLQKGLAFAGVDSAKEEVKRLDDVILKLEKDLEEIENKEPSTKLEEGIKKVTKAFEGTVNTTSRAIKGQKEFLELQLRTTVEIAKQEKALAGLAEQRQILQDISDDDTLSFIERKKFIDLAQKAALEFADLENKLALTKEKLTIEAIKQDLRRISSEEKKTLGITKNTIEQIKTGEQLQNLLQRQDIARKVSDANDEAFTAAFVERRNKEVEAESFRRDQEEKNRITARDAFEQEIDIIQELGEQRIAQNQKVLADDTKSIAERREALSKNNEQEEKIFNESIERIRKQGIESIKLSDRLTEAEKEKRIALIETADIQAILNEEDQVKALNQIRLIQLGEGEERVLKETLKLKKDISAQNEEDAKALEETSRKTQELKDDILIQEKKIKDETFDLQKAEFENQKKDLEDRIKLLKEDSIQRLELEKQLNALKLEEQEKTNEEEEKNTKDSAEKRAEAVQKAAELVTNIVEKQNEKRLQAIDDTLNAVEERQSSLRAAAEQGNEQAVKSLAESEKQEAEIRQQKERELQRQQRIEAGLAAFQVFAANSQEDPKTALTKTITDITTLSALISSLPSFFVGTEDTGKASNALDQNGGRLSILHDNERVMTAEQNKAIGPMTNEELTRLAVETRRGTFKQFEQVKPNEMNSVLIQSQQESIKDDIQQLIKEVRKNRPIDPVSSFDKRTSVYSEIYKQGNNKVRNHKKVFTAKNRN
jgi:hypothetical protein